MGSIYKIWKNPKSWIVSPLPHLKLKSTGEELVNVQWGEVDDYLVIYSLEIYMRKSIYDNIGLGKKYYVEYDNEHNIIVKEYSTGNIVPPISEGEVY